MSAVSLLLNLSIQDLNENNKDTEKWLNYVAEISPQMKQSELLYKRYKSHSLCFCVYLHPAYTLYLAAADN